MFGVGQADGVGVGGGESLEAARAEIITALVDVTTGRFITDGRAADGVELVRVELPRPPDDRRERYTGDQAAPFRSATADEVRQVERAAALDAAAIEFDQSPMVAALVSWLAKFSGRSIEGLRAEVLEYRAGLRS